MPTIRAELLNITGKLIAEKIMSSGLDIDGKFVVTIDEDGKAQVTLDGNLLLNRLQYKILPSDQTHVDNGSFITHGGSYVLPKISGNVSTEIRVLVISLSRVAVKLEFSCDGSDFILQGMSDVTSDMTYHNSVLLDVNTYYRLVGIGSDENIGYWIVEKSEGLL